MVMRKLLPLIGALCLTAVPTGHAIAAPARRSVLVVHLRVSGGLNGQETRRTSDSTIGSCFQWGVYGQRYTVRYYSTAWLKARTQGHSPDGFVLDMYPYRRGLTLHASSLSHLLLTLIVHHRVYADGWFDRPDARSAVAGGFVFMVRVAKDGRSGTFLARHVPAGQATTGPAIDARGSWSCSALGT